jgi:hypothetical protein
MLHKGCQLKEDKTKITLLAADNKPLCTVDPRALQHAKDKLVLQEHISKDFTVWTLIF